MSILSEILADKRSEVHCAKKRVPLAMLETVISSLPEPRDFKAALLRRVAPALIAEVKKASPSKGVIREDFDPVLIAQTYADNGAACLSVLTDEPYFQGHLSYLRAIREAVEVPLLRKDFMVDPYQIYEARANGADAILLIVAALTRDELLSLLEVTRSLNMAALVEVHNPEELEIAIGIGAKLIGINNRDLHTFRTTLASTVELMASIPEDCIVVSESGINTMKDVEKLRDAGVHAVLIGESLMRETDIAAKMASLGYVGALA